MAVLWRRKSKKVRLILLRIALLSACLVMVSCRNVRQYDKGNIRLLTRYWRKNQYAQLLIGTPTKPYRQIPPILIRMSDGTIINTGTAEQTLIESKCRGSSDWSGVPFTEGFGVPPIDSSASWPNGTTRFQDLFRIFFVNRGKIISLTLEWQPGQGPDKPEIGDPRTGRMYLFPLTQAQVIALFGPPDKFTEYMQK